MNTLYDLNEGNYIDFIYSTLEFMNVDFNYIDDDYVNKFKSLLISFLSSEPKIKDFENILNYKAEICWEIFKRDYSDYYVNLFNKICSTLREYNDLDDALYSLCFFSEIKKCLKGKYEELEDAIAKYHYMYHKGKELDLKEYLDVISDLSALYVAKKKEEYKKEFINETFTEIQKYFTLNLENEVIKKKIDYLKKKKEFKKMYRCNNLEINKFISNLYNLYKNEIDETLFYKMVNKFIINGDSKLNDIIIEPIDYKNYEKHKKARQIVKRLNLGNIKIDSNEAENYLDIIYFDHLTNKYKCFDYEYGNNVYSEYDKYKAIFESIKKAIAKKINTIDVSNIPISEDIIIELKKNLPFNDVNYKFDLENNLKHITIDEVRKYTYLFEYVDSIKNNYEEVYNILIKNKYLWIYLLLDLNAASLDFNILYTIKNISYIKHLSSDLKLDLDKFEDIAILTKICRCKDDDKFLILGVENLKKIYDSKGYANDSDNEIIDNAVDLICNMTKRNTSTVPYIYGVNKNYKYTMYDSFDEDIITCGINTDSCFRLGSNDSDFLRYCALDKNGFVIKITDLNDNFLAKASGFRNGNTVFINQLRTIYDVSGYGYNSEYEAEKEEIIETFIMACDDIVKKSVYPEKINYVIATKSYSLSELKSNVDNAVTKKIGYYPMDNKSDDWYKFLKNTKYLKEAEIDNYFTTDYGYYPLICISHDIPLNAKNMNFYDAKDIYKRRRNPVLFGKIKDLEKEIKRITAIRRQIENQNIELIIPENSYVFKGDNWYIIIDYEKNIIDYYCSNNDEDMKEFEFILNDIEKNNNMILRKIT